MYKIDDKQHRMYFQICIKKINITQIKLSNNIIFLDKNFICLLIQK